MADEKKFSFLEEEVLESKRPRKQLVGRIKRAAISGVVFGVVAACGFHVVDDVFAGEEEEDVPQQIQLGTSATPQETAQEKMQAQEKDVKLENRMSSAHKLGRLSKRSKNYLVGVHAVSENNQNAYWYQDDTAVSGVIVAQTKKYLFVLTPYDMIREKKKVQVRFLDDTTVNGVVYQSDAKKNLAIVRVQKQPIQTTTLNKLETVDMAESVLLDVGDEVYALGSPNGMLYSAEYGYITSEKRKRSVEDYQMDAYTTSMLYHSEGNGIICNAEGEMIGIIATSTENTENCTFYGITKLKPVIESLLNETPQIYSGVLACDIPDDRKSGHNLKSGIYVEGVSEDSPAYKAGILVGDVILAVDGEPIHSVVEYYQCLQHYGVDTQVTVTIARNAFEDKKEKKVKMQLE